MQALELRSKTPKGKLKSIQDEQSDIRRDLESAEHKASLEHLKLTVLLHEVLANAGLLEPDEDVQGQCEAEASFVERYAVPDGTESPSIRPDSIGQPNPSASRHLEHLADNSSGQDFDRRRQDLKNARARFDAYRDSARNVEGGSTDADAGDLREGMRLTRELIEAEQHFRTAKAAAIANGIDVFTSDQTSGFGDADGQAQHRATGPENYLNVQQWLEPLPEMIDPKRSARGFLDAIDAQCDWKVEIPELDEWSAGAPALMKDSASVVAQGRARVRINVMGQAGEVDRAAVRKHWAEQNPRGLTAEQWDRAHRVFETGR